MTNSEINSVVMIAVAFLIGGVLMAFIATGVAEADKKASNKVQLHNQDQLNQLIMYNTLIAHVCDDSVNAGALDNTGDRMYDSWKSYKKVWVQSNGNPGDQPVLFDDLNKTFPRQELNCIGTGTTFGATSPGTFINPTDKEWRNDMEGKHSRVRFVINSTKNWYQGRHNPYGQGDERYDGGNVPNPTEAEAGHPNNDQSDNYVWTPPCFWFDTSKNSDGLQDRSNGNKGFEGITDASYYFAAPDHMNMYFRFWGGEAGGPAPHPNGCEDVWRRVNIKNGGSLGELEGGAGIMVTVIYPGVGSNNNDFYRRSHTMIGQPCRYEPGEGNKGRCLGGKLSDYNDESLRYISDDVLSNNEDYTKYRIEYDEVKFCKGMRGYIQTNTGYTVNQAGLFPNEDPPSYRLGNLPGFADKERWNPLNAPKDNSLHPVIVINDMGSCA